MNKSFTLIELIIYIGIVAAILLVAVNFGWEIIYGNVKSQAVREVQENARFVMEKITRTIEKASAINSPTPGNSASSLSLEMADSDENPTVFELSDNKLQVTYGGSGVYELTNNRVRISNLQFTNLSYEDTPGTVKIEMTISHFNPGNLNQYEASSTLKSSASLMPGGAAAAE